MAFTALARRPQTARSNPPRAATRVVVREVARAPARRRRSGGGALSGGRGLMNTGVTVQRGIVAYALGAMQRAGTLARVPTLGQFGAEATVSVVAGMMGGGSPLAQDIALAAGLVALNQLGREGLTGTPAAAGVGAAKPDPYAVEGDDD